MEDTKMIAIDLIEPNPYQPRLEFDQDALMDLAQSIRENGLIQPITVRKVNDKYQIIAGERRFRALRLNGAVEVPANIMDADEVQMAEMALVENIQRENLNSIEEAKAYQMMMERLNLKQDELAKRIGKSRSYIANTLRLLQLPEMIQNYVLEGKITMGHARCLITLPQEKAESLAARCIEEGLSVRDVENIVKGIELGNSRKIVLKLKNQRNMSMLKGY